MNAQDFETNPYKDWLQHPPDRFIKYIMTEIRHQTTLIQQLSKAMEDGETPMGAPPNIQNLKIPQLISSCALKISLVLDVTAKYVNERDRQQKKSKGTQT